MSQPARLTSSLLARKGQAFPAGGQARAAIGPSQPLPPMTPRSPQPHRADNVRSLGSLPARTAGRPDQKKASKDGRVALTVKLDPVRHARLRILAARQHRTSQDLMIDALDALLEACGPACECMRNGAGCNVRN